MLTTIAIVAAVVVGAITGWRMKCFIARTAQETENALKTAGVVYEAGIRAESHAPTCSCPECRASRERELLRGISEWNRIVSGISPVRFQPHSVPETRQ